MKKAYKNSARVLSLLTVFVILIAVLLFLQAVLMPKYRSAVLEGALIGEYYHAKTKHNVLFIGDCEVYESFSPVTLWEEYGISSYIRGSAQQLIWQSYYLLCEAIDRGEKPEAVVFNVLAMKYDTPQHEEYNRMTLDRMAWSKHKISAICASMTEEEDFVTYLFPLLRYHDRIAELKAEDFTALFCDAPEISYNGYLMKTGIVPMGEQLAPPTLYPDELISEVAFDYLDRMRLLCEENGIKLVLVKAPTNNWKYHWYDDWEQQIASYANRYDLSYYNFIGMEEAIGIDWNTDTYDAGIHLNVYGAEKLSRYFGNLLISDLGVSDLRSDRELSAEWSKIVTRYQTEKNAS